MLVSKRPLSVVLPIIARTFSVFLALLAVSWALFSGALFWRQYPILNTATQILAENSLKPEALTALELEFSLPGMQERRSSNLRALAVVDLRLLELALSLNRQREIDVLMRKTEAAIRNSLVNSPSDPFLWTVLFWLDSTQNGFSRDHLQYLRLSYLTGPNEGWVAVKRNRFSLAVYNALTPELAQHAVSEFSRLVGSNFFYPAADILAGPGWPIRDLLMSGLKGVDEKNRLTFDKVIYRRGFGISVPGTSRPDWRPWHWW